MPLSAWLMFVFGCIVLYGGLALCVIIAVCKNKKSKSTNEPPVLS